MNESVTVTKETQHLAYLAGCMNAARRDYKRALAENAPASVIEELKGDAMGCEEDFRMEFAAYQALEELGAAPVAVQAVPVKVSRVKCPHYRAIRRAFAIAKDAGLDVSKAGKARARHAMENVIGQCVESRSEYSGSDWMRFGDAIKAGRAAW
jgi:hypothetical protein